MDEVGGGAGVVLVCALKPKSKCLVDKRAATDSREGAGGLPEEKRGALWGGLFVYLC